MELTLPRIEPVLLRIVKLDVRPLDFSGASADFFPPGRDLRIVEPDTANRESIVLIIFPRSEVTEHATLI
eukprot:4266561-Prymnesium_polylepis.1